MPALEFASFHPPLARTRRFGSPSPSPSPFMALSARVCVIATMATSLITVSLATPNVAAAAPTQDEAAPSSAEAEAMFRRGQAKYETADYKGAIELWTEAYTLVGSSVENASIKALLIYNLAQAHLKAFDLDKDQIHLKQALQLLESFRSNLTLLYDDQALVDEETSKVNGRIAEVEAMLNYLEAPNPEPEPEPKPVVEPVQDPAPVDQDSPSGTPLIATGGTVLGLGALFGVVGVVGGLMASGANDISALEPDDLQGREDQFATGRSGNTMVIVGAVGAGVLVPTGIALIVVGAMRNKKLARRDDTRAQLRPSVSPSFGGVWGGGGGLTISGRF